MICVHLLLPLMKLSFEGRGQKDKEGTAMPCFYSRALGHAGPFWSFWAEPESFWGSKNVLFVLLGN